MKWAAGTREDLALGPQFARRFDLTLRFEQIFLTILPAILLIVLSILYLRYYYRQPVRILSGRILWLKFTAVGALVVAEGIALGFWCSSSILRNGTSVVAALMTFFAAVCIAFVLNAEHRRALQSSALTGVYLLVAVLFDIAKIRSYLCRTNMQAFAGLAIASALLKCILLALLEIPKKKYIADVELKKTVGPETLSGFWNRSFFVWLNRTLLFGFRNIITVEDLEPLGPEFSSKKLSEKLESRWTQMNQATQYCLAKACFATFYTDFVSVVPPRLSFTGFVFAQPLFLRHAVEYVGDSDESASIRAGLIAASALIFIGVATSRAIYSHMNYRMAALLRGAIIPLIFKKTMLLPHASATDSAATTLMSTDVEGIVNGVPKIHEIWAAIVEIGLGLYLLTTVIDQAAFLVVIPVIASAAAAFGLAKLMGPAWAAWNKVIEERVSQTSRALTLAKSIKMVGLQTSVSDRLQKLRLKEIASFKTVRRLAILTTVTAVTAYTFTPIIAIAGGLFWTSFEGTLTAVNAFTTVTVVLMVTKPLLDIIYAYGYFKTTLSCFERIEVYLKLEELAHQLTTAGGSMSTSEEKVAKESARAQNDTVIEFIGASIAPAGNTQAKLKNVSFTLERSQITAVTGPVGAGKTLLLQAMLREAAIVEGQASHEQCTVAYCGQRPWLRNQSVRECVVGNGVFEEGFYQSVIDACQLSEDIKQLPGGKGDCTLVGSSGANLSGGQKHRLALARAVYSRSQMLLLDDPLSGIDASMARDIYSSLLGVGGILRKSATTVVLATHSAIFLKEADRALIIDDGGNISVHQTPKELALTTECEESTKSDPNTQSEVQLSPTGLAASALEKTDDAEADDVRCRGDFGLHIFFLRSTRTWMLVVWAVALVLQVATERFPEVFLRIWLETDAANNRYFIGYALIGTSSFFVSGFAFGFFYLKLVPDSAAQLHKLLLDSVMGATLTFLTSTDTGSIINRFSQDMTILTQNLPKALLETVYLATYALFDLAIIFSAAKYSAILLPFLAVALYFIQKYYLRTSRQMRHLDIEAKTPLYSLFGDISSGLEHIRAYEWQSDLYEESLKALDYSQKPFYYMFTIQRWLELVMDCTTLVLAVTLVATTTFYKETTTQAALGLSMLNLVTFSTLLNMVIGAWITMETALGAIARLRSFISKTPVEEIRSGVSLPQNWPDAGNVEFVNVTAKYNETDSSPALSEATFSIDAGRKIGITGRSGSGKTSLLLTLLNFIDYTGTIEIDGINISTISRLELRSRITSLSQDAIVLDGTVRENLLPYTGQYDDTTIDDDLILKVLAGVNLAEEVKNKGGLEIQLSALSLSEGQKQLLCLSRAILHNHWSRSRLVLLDEPTSSLDHETDERIQALMREMFKDCTVLVVTHRANALWDADVRLEVENGKVSRHVTES